MNTGTFFCIDAHTCGNPVRVVAGGAPPIPGRDASERRMEFIERFDWIRTGLMYEPRGHDLMSGSILCPPLRDDCDLGVVYIETSGSLPMCGHGTIGTVTVVLERNLVTPREPGVLRLDTPAGVVTARYTQDGPHVESVRLQNIPSYLHATGVRVECPDLGELTVDIAYGGNYYAIVDRQPNFGDMADHTAADLLRWSPILRQRVNEVLDVVHPVDPNIRRVTHIMWTGDAQSPEAHRRNAVFYGDKAIDRSPCGTGTSARMAQLVAKGELGIGGAFVHESIIGSLFHGRVEGAAKVGPYDAIIPSIQGWARITGFNTIFIDERDPYRHGFVVK
jgi:4-hydroxyproline epimerase